jgi:hypothetical protein
MINKKLNAESAFYDIILNNESLGSFKKNVSKASLKLLATIRNIIKLSHNFDEISV